MTEHFETYWVIKNYHENTNVYTWISWSIIKQWHSYLMTLFECIDCTVSIEVDGLQSKGEARQSKLSVCCITLMRNVFRLNKKPSSVKLE